MQYTDSVQLFLLYKARVIVTILKSIETLLLVKAEILTIIYTIAIEHC